MLKYLITTMLSEQLRKTERRVLTTCNDTLYVAASWAANTVGGGLGGVKIFRLAQ